MDLINKKIKLYRKTRALYYSIKNNVDKADLEATQLYYQKKEFYLVDQDMFNFLETKQKHKLNYITLSQESLKNLREQCITLKKELKEHFRKWKA
jgi:hypothetical protein